MMISYVPRTEISSSRWDATVSSAANGLVYARSSYLDLLADHWDAIVIDDYRAVMPLPYRIKYGIRYIYQPAFVQQLGLIGHFSKDELQACIDLAQQKFRYAGYNLNFDNGLPSAKACNNFILDLQRPYEEIAKGFTYYLRRNTKEDRTRDLQYKHGASPEKGVQLYRKLYGSRFPHVKERSYRGLLEFAAQNPAMVVYREAWNKDELLSVIILLNDGKRLYLLVSATTDQGQAMEANRFVLDQLIREYAGQPLLLDFEGSDLPGVAAYYAGFGAENQQYYTMRWNTHPLLRLLGL